MICRDAHLHLYDAAVATGLVSARDCKSADDLLALVARHAGSAADAPSSERWLRIHGAKVASWPSGTWPSRDAFDHAAGSELACIVMSFDVHFAFCNQCALERAGLAGVGQVGKSGRVHTDSTGAPTGVVEEDAAYMVWKAAPAPPAQARESLVCEALGELSRLNIGHIHDMHAQEWLGSLLSDLDRRDLLPCSVGLYAPASRLAWFAGDAQSWQSPRVRLAGGKVFLDGTLSGNTALMLEPYVDPLDPQAPCGRAMMSREELESAIADADALGLPLAMHAIGDGAVRLALDAIQAVGPETRGFRIEHAELIDEADIDRFKALDVICSPQPCHLLTDIESLMSHLPHRLDRVLPLRDLVDAGLEPGRMLQFGSDAPIVSADPADSILAATSRRRASMPVAESIAPAQQITAPVAWACFGDCHV